MANDDDMAAALAEIEAEEAKKKAAGPATVGSGAPGRQINKEAIYDVPIEISVVLGKADLLVHQLLKLGRGAVVELDRRSDEPVDVFADDILIARGEVTVTDDDKLGVSPSPTSSARCSPASRVRGQAPGRHNQFPSSSHPRT